MILSDDTSNGVLDKRAQAILVMKTLKANHPLSDKLIADLFKAINLGVDFSTISSCSDLKGLLSCEDPTTVKSVTFCVGCGSAVESLCVNER